MIVTRMPILSRDEINFFKTNGYLIVRSVLDPALMAQTRDGDRAALSPYRRTVNTHGDPDAGIIATQIEKLPVQDIAHGIGHVKEVLAGRYRSEFSLTIGGHDDAIYSLVISIDEFCIQFVVRIAPRAIKLCTEYRYDFG